MSTDQGITETKNREQRRAEALQARPAVTPAVDIYENDREVLLVADLPGVGTDGLNLSFDNGQLTLEGRRAQTGDWTPVAAEFRPLDYRRTFLVPDGVEVEKIAAEIRQGVLWVHLPKAEPLRPRRIAVKGQ